MDIWENDVLLADQNLTPKYRALYLKGRIHQILVRIWRFVL